MAMFTQKKDGFGGTTVIAEGVELKGDFRGAGPMVIDGTVLGSVSTHASIEVGATAVIEADVTAQSLIIAGTIKGNVIAKDRLELLATARIEGDVTTKVLVIAEGASMNGRCMMNEGGTGREKPSAKQRDATE